MTLAPRPPDQTPRIFSTYDLEWYPKTLTFRMAGVYDPQRGYRCYSSANAFLNSELVPENYGRTFYAHNAGKSDVHFVLESLIGSYLAERRYILEAAFNGSSAFLLTASERSNPKLSFTFSDTLFLLKASLRKIGEWLGFPKLTEDFETKNWNALRFYNERDCEILYRAVAELEAEIHQMGGEFRLTLASSAMALFQTKYLIAPLHTDHDTNTISRKSYYASRVEVFTRRCDSANYFDVNSSFPWSMKKTLPGRFLRTTRTLTERPPSAKCYSADATVTVKHDTYLPPLPYRDEEERILFPVGTWRAFFTDVDLELAELTGHRIEKIHSVDWYDGFTDLSDYVDDLYAKKATATGFKREVYKLFLNALYGKFAEGETKEKVLLFPESIACTHKVRHANNECMSMVRPGIWKREDFRSAPHTHVPISASVTAWSRRLLFDQMSKCNKLYYTDTDSIITDSVMPTGEGVGEMKLEYVIRAGKFAAPKFYMLDDGDKVSVRSKGFSRLDGASYLQLCKGEAVTLHRMSGLKENLRSGDMRPRNKDVVKFARFKTTKRADDGKLGETRPWHIDELEDA